MFLILPLKSIRYGGLFFQLKDGWTLATQPGFDTIQYEHTLVVTRGKPVIITQLSR